MLPNSYVVYWEPPLCWCLGRVLSHVDYNNYIFKRPNPTQTLSPSLRKRPSSLYSEQTRDERWMRTLLATPLVCFVHHPPHCYNNHCFLGASDKRRGRIVCVCVHSDGEHIQRARRNGLCRLSNKSNGVSTAVWGEPRARSTSHSQRPPPTGWKKMSPCQDHGQ